MGKQWKQWQTLFSWAPKSLQMVTAAIKLKTLAPWKKSYDHPRQHIKKQRYYFANKFCQKVKAMIFPIVMYGCESWTIKKSEHWRIDAFELWCWRRLLWVSWTAGDPIGPFWRRSALGFPWKDWCWSWNSNTLATSCELLTHWKRLWCWEGLGAGGEGDDRGWVVGWHHRLDGHEFQQVLWVGDGQGSLACCSPWGRKESDTTEN